MLEAIDKTATFQNYIETVKICKSIYKSIYNILKFDYICNYL